jgi:hypothetical protein
MNNGGIGREKSLTSLGHDLHGQDGDEEKLQ